MNEDDKPCSAPELCLQLIMILPEVEDRKQQVKYFCALYDIRDKNPPHLREVDGADTLQRIAGGK